MDTTQCDRHLESLEQSTRKYLETLEFELENGLYDAAIGTAAFIRSNLKTMKMLSDTKMCALGKYDQ